MNVKIKKVILILIILLILIFIIKVLFFSNFLTFIKMKNYIKNLDKNQSIKENPGKICNIYSEDKKRVLQINLPDKFDYNNGGIFLNTGLEAVVCVNKSTQGVAEINNFTFGNSFRDGKTEFFKYNNSNLAIASGTILDSIISYERFNFDIVMPIDLQYYYYISFNDYAFNKISFKKEDIEALLNFKVIK